MIDKYFHFEQLDSDEQNEKGRINTMMEEVLVVLYNGIRFERHQYYVVEDCVGRKLNNIYNKYKQSQHLNPSSYQSNPIDYNPSFIITQIEETLSDKNNTDVTKHN